MNKSIGVLAAALGMISMSATMLAAAADVDVRINVPGVYQPQQPVYVQPAPVYVQQRPVYVREAPRRYYDRRELKCNKHKCKHKGHGHDRHEGHDSHDGHHDNGHHH